MVKVAVIGAGINGLACAIKIKEHFESADVVVVSHQFSPNTTGDGAGGLWYPYLCGTTPESKINKWGSATYKLLHKLWLEGGNNISSVPIYYFFPETINSKPEWAGSVFGYEILNRRQMDYYNQLHSAQYGGGIRFTTFVTHATSFLKYLKERYDKANGKTLVGKVSSLDDPILQGFDVIVNCTGLGARYIVPDKEVFPIRGQISKVTAPWVNHVIIDDVTGNYIIPNFQTCVLGGTHQEHDYNTEVDIKDKEFIINGCDRLTPGVKHADLIEDWVGLRPGRCEVRLDSEERHGKLIIHNYGHGGSGLTLFWGCADSVLEILQEKLQLHNSSKSKL